MSRMKTPASMVVAAIAVATPWRLKRWIYVRLLGWDVSRSAHVGMSFVHGPQVVLEDLATIRSFTVVRHCTLEMGRNSILGSFNWVTGVPANATGRYSEETQRRSVLIIEKEASVTSRHYIDCTDSVRIGAFSVVAGVRSVIWTHSIDVSRCRQACAPVCVGEYSMVGSTCVILPGAILPAHSILGAGSVLRGAVDTEFALYSGIPAKNVAILDAASGFFHRSTGRVQ